MNNPTLQAKLPDPEPPILTTVMSAPVYPEDDAARVVGCPHCKQSITLPADKKGAPLRWVLGSKHPLFENLQVIRMFFVEDRGGVEVYSVTGDRKTGVRHFIPSESLLLLEEGMPMDVFIEELSDAESDGGGDDPEPPDPPEPQPVPNGQTPS